VAGLGEALLRALPEEEPAEEEEVKKEVWITVHGVEDPWRDDASAIAGKFRFRFIHDTLYIYIYIYIYKEEEVQKEVWITVHGVEDPWRDDASAIAG